jgi:rod shape-determining protein MreD
VLRYGVAGGLLLFAALIQSVIGSSVPLLGTRPDFPLVVVVAWGMLRGPGEGAVVGFLGGMLFDAVAYTPYGLNAAVLGLIGFATGLGETNLYRGNIPFFLGTGAAATVVFHVVRFLVLQAMGSALPPFASVLSLAATAAVVNAVLLAPTFLLCRRLLRALGGFRRMEI